jgi:hypothetical protein
MLAQNVTGAPWISLRENLYYFNLAIQQARRRSELTVHEQFSEFVMFELGPKVGRRV